jgi:hypothetical protein
MMKGSVAASLKRAEKVVAIWGAGRASAIAAGDGKEDLPSTEHS